VRWWRVIAEPGGGRGLPAPTQTATESEEPTAAYAPRSRAYGDRESADK
jgi:hypothetical protein